MLLKKHLRGKSHLFAYLRFCVREEKNIKKRSLYNVNVLKTPMSPQHGSCKHTNNYMNLVVETRTLSTFQPHKK